MTSVKFIPRVDGVCGKFYHGVVKMQLGIILSFPFLLDLLKNSFKLIYQVSTILMFYVF